MNNLERNLCAQRLKECREKNNYTLEYIGEKIGVHKSTILRWENGETSKIKNPILKELADFYNVNVVWLMGYDVPINKTSNAKIAPISIPILGKISAGLPVLAEENIEGYTYAPAITLKSNFEYFYLRVQGDSMNTKFNDGDLVLVQKQESLENGEIGVIRVNGCDATVKRFKKQDNLVILEPMSTNPKNTVQIYDIKSISINIDGKVVAFLGSV